MAIFITEINQILNRLTILTLHSSIELGNYNVPDRLHIIYAYFIAAVYITVNLVFEF